MKNSQITLNSNWIIIRNLIVSIFAILFVLLANSPAFAIDKEIIFSSQNSLEIEFAKQTEDYVISNTISECDFSSQKSYIRLGEADCGEKVYLGASTDFGYALVELLTLSLASEYTIPARTATKTGTQFTKSSLKIGQQMHKAYKANLHNPAKRLYKEFTGVKGIRPDFVDMNKRIIYELKPNNPRQIKAGWKQLNNYKTLFEQQYGSTWKIVLDLY